VPSVIRPSLAVVEEAIPWTDNAIRESRPSHPLDFTRPDGCTLDKARSQLLSVRAWCRSLGGIPNHDSETSHCRLFPTSGIHLAKLPQEVRRLLLRGTGLVDLDLRSACSSLFHSLAHSTGIPCPLVSEYLFNKEQIHRQWARRLGRSPAMIDVKLKRVTASFLCGGSLAPTGMTEAGKLLSAEGVRLLASETFAKSLLSEVRAILEALVGAETKRHGKYSVLVKATGNHRHFADEHDDFRKASCDLLTGYEQGVIREMSWSQPASSRRLKETQGRRVNRGRALWPLSECLHGPTRPSPFLRNSPRFHAPDLLTAALPADRFPVLNA
jgi:hypothetical protein